jgi:hypothetical protein
MIAGTRRHAWKRYCWSRRGAHHRGFAESPEGGAKPGRRAEEPWPPCQRARLRPSASIRHSPASCVATSTWLARAAPRWINRGPRRKRTLCPARCGGRDCYAVDHAAGNPAADDRLRYGHRARDSRCGLDLSHLRVPGASPAERRRAAAGVPRAQTGERSGLSNRRLARACTQNRACCRPLTSMSALPLIADEQRTFREVRFVP